MVIQSSMSKRTDRVGFLNSIKLFENLESQKKLKLIDGLEQIEFRKDNFVFKQGDQGEEFFIIERGEVDCLKEAEDGGFGHVRTLKRGDHFGELALINSDKRSLSIRAKSEWVTLLMLDRHAFTRILGSID
jgi:cAMP-dependent protein kinase regulator